VVDEPSKPLSGGPPRWLTSVRATLDAAPAPVPVFFRDDDAGWRDDRLDALLARFARAGVPVDLAVIPAALAPAAARRLRGAVEGAGGRIGVHQHGFAHRNHETEGRKHEFGPSRDHAAQRRDIEAGRARLAELLGPVVEPVFTPPWNRCTATTGRCLAELGFAVLSRMEGAEPFGLSGLRELPVRVDWFAHRRGTRLTRAELGDRLAAAVAAPGPLGIMLHHPVMDDAELDDLDALLALLAGHPRVRFGRILALAREGPGHAPL
jgi:peptidoglycan/xylan/chitin deacetylase (PgdA/CDA1 family)